MFAGAAVLGMGLLLLPMLARHGFAPSTLIVAGDRFVNAGATPAPIVVRRHSDGYDGQFYYRIAAAPFDAAPVAAGVRFDHPAWRMQRVLYPLLAWLGSLGRPAAVPGALLGVNLAALFALLLIMPGFGATARDRAALFLATALWPGVFIALTHDTTEIVAGALLAAALAAHLRGRALAFAVLGSLAVLTRETAVLMMGGIFLAEIMRGRERIGRMPAAAAPLAVFAAWHGWLWLAWPGGGDPGAAGRNVGPPFVGAVTQLAAELARAGAPHTHVFARAVALTAVAGILLILGFGAIVAPAAVRLARGGGPLRGVALGWMAVAALVSALSAGGPWIELTAYFRAATEFWISGWVLLAGARACPGAGAVLGLLPFAAMNWVLCLAQLK